MGVVLIGMMGAGKTTIGQLLAERTGSVFVDLDALIEQESNAKIHEIFARFGEDEFRKLESQALAGIRPTPRQVVSVGGGAPCSVANFERIRQLGTVIYLHVSPESLAERIEKDVTVRPKLGADPLGDLRRLLAERETFYLQADIVLDADKSPDEIVEDIRVRIGW